MGMEQYNINLQFSESQVWKWNRSVSHSMVFFLFFWLAAHHIALLCLCYCWPKNGVKIWIRLTFLGFRIGWLNSIFFLLLALRILIVRRDMCVKRGSPIMYIRAHGTHTAVPWIHFWSIYLHTDVSELQSAELFDVIIAITHRDNPNWSNIFRNEKQKKNWRKKEAEITHLRKINFDWVNRKTNRY